MAPQNSFARAFLALGPVMDRRGAAAHRHALVQPARGIVVEIGAGYGATFAHYPTAVQPCLLSNPIRSFGAKR